MVMMLSEEQETVMERMDKQPVEQLPEALAVLADPGKALNPEVQAAYEPPAHEKLNMARIGVVFTLSIGVLGVLFALVINRDQLSFYGVILAMCILALIWVQGKYRRHNRAGGDSDRLGTYVLPEGIMHIESNKEGKRFVSFLPRKEVQGFVFDVEADEYAHTVISVQTKDGIWEGYAFPSVGMLHPWHKNELELWLAEGNFRWEDYKRPKNPQAQ